MWERYRETGTVLPETEYEEAPRGRVMYNTKTRLFTLLADRCILKKMALLTQIKKEYALAEEHGGSRRQPLSLLRLPKRVRVDCTLYWFAYPGFRSVLSVDPADFIMWIELIAYLAALNLQM